MTTKTLVLCALIVGACQSGAMWTEVDSWYREPPERSFQDWESLPEDDFAAVAEDRLAQAVRLLESEAVVEISADEAHELASLGSADGRYFLVRGICLGCRTGSFSIFVHMSNLVVAHGSLASRALPMTRWPVVVTSLPERPSQVYVTATSDG